MKKILIVTYVDFWRGGAGHRARLAAIINYLKNKIDITVSYIGTISQSDIDTLTEKFPEIIFDVLEKDQQLSPTEYAEKFSSYIQGRHFDIALLEFVETYAILDYLSPSTVTILDTHDIVSDRVQSFERLGVKYSGTVINFEQELQMFSKFDYVALINKPDFEKVNTRLSSEKLLLIPHPVEGVKAPIRQEVKTISFVASEYQPNINAIEWFIAEVWPAVAGNNLQLKIYGNVGKQLANTDYSNGTIEFAGFANSIDEIYLNADIVINPVMAGAGLKIKSVEALGYGVPLVTTTHGASGIENGYPGCFLLADSDMEFIQAIKGLINNFEKRNEISINAYNYAREHFSLYSGVLSPLMNL